MGKDAYPLFDIHSRFDLVVPGQKFVDRHGNLWLKISERAGQQRKKVNALEAYKQIEEAFFNNGSSVRILAIREA